MGISYAAVPATLCGVILASCVGESGNRWDYSCASDSGCEIGSVCARTGDCVDEREIISVRLTWRINDIQPSVSEPGTCAGIRDLSVAFEFDWDQYAIIYEPVPCELGQTYYDKMPNWIDAVLLTVWNDRGQPIDERRAILSRGENNVTFDLAR